MTEKEDLLTQNLVELIALDYSVVCHSILVFMLSNIMLKEKKNQNKIPPMALSVLISSLRTQPIQLYKWK